MSFSLVTSSQISINFADISEVLQLMKSIFILSIPDSVGFGGYEQM